jgi:hypothetical protein
MTGRIRVKELSPAQERDMEKEIIFLVEEAPEGGYTARALGHNIFTEADSFAELKKMVQDATQCHFEAKDTPRLIHLHNHSQAQISQGRHSEQYRE